MSYPYRVWAEIDLNALKHNVACLRQKLKPQTRIMAVLKADAYGHGACEVAWALTEVGVDAFGVGDSQEALELRHQGIKLPILILGAIIPGEIQAVVENDLEINIHSLEMAEEVNRHAARMGRPAKVHIMVDTGMGRLGVDCYNGVSLLQKIKKLPFIQLQGICTHFSSPSETNEAFTKVQISRFETFKEAARSLGIQKCLFHAASHTAFLRYPQSEYDMIRPGLVLYGVCAFRKEPSLELQRVLSLRSQVLFVKNVSEGTPIGYSRLWYAPAPTCIATIPVGYNDGLRIALSGKAEVLIRGKRCPVVGRISMDYIMVDAGGLENLKRGERVTLIGQDGQGEISIEEIAAQLGTLPYEITCSLGRRVKRLYHGQSILHAQSRRNAQIQKNLNFDDIEKVA